MRRENKGGFTPLERSRINDETYISKTLISHRKSGLKVSPFLTGFTFIEIIIVMITVAFISLGIYAIFNNGIKVWQRINQQLPSEDLNIFFEKFSSDVENSFKYSGIGFLGDGNSFEFAALINSTRLKAKTVGKIAYFYDPAKKMLQREVSDYSGVYNGEQGLAKEAIRGIDSLKFRFYFYDKEKKKYLWSDEWARESGFPLAVRVELEIEDINQTNNFIKTVAIPVGG